MVQSIYEESLNFKKAQQRFHNLRTENCSRGLGTAPSIADRMDKMGKILSLMNSPYEGEARNSARLAIKLSMVWGIDLGLLQDPSIKQEKSLADREVQSDSAHFFSSHVTEFSGPEIRRRTSPVFVKAHVRRRSGGPPFPVRPHRRRRRART